MESCFKLEINIISNLIHNRFSNKFIFVYKIIIRGSILLPPILGFYLFIEFMYKNIMFELFI